MALINKQDPAVNPVPQKPTLDVVVNNIKRVNTQLYQSMKMNHTNGYNLVWNNPFYTPTEIVAAFGVDGVALFRTYR